MSLCACLRACCCRPRFSFPLEPQTQTFEQAVKALSSGDYGAAEEGFQKVLATSPEHLGALQNLGLVYSRTERLDQAIAVYRRGLAAQSQSQRPADESRPGIRAAGRLRLGVARYSRPW